MHFPFGPIAHIAVAALAFGLGCIWLSHKFKRERPGSLRYDLAREAGIALIVAAAVVVSVDVSVSKRHSEQLGFFLQQIAQARLPLELRSAVGEDLAIEIERQLVKQPIQYERFRVAGEITMVGAKVVGDFTVTTRVINTSQAEVRYPIQSKLSDLRPGKFLEFQHLRFFPADARGKQSGRAIIDLDKDAIKRLVRRPSSTEARIDTTVMLNGQGSYGLSRRMKFSDDVNGYYNVRSRFACKGMELELVVPDSLEVSCDFGYPTGDDTEWRREGNRVMARIGATALPYQGIFVAWRSRAPAKGKGVRAR